MKEDGTYITNRWGDRVVKHYYQDSDGNYYLDKSGNWILIPIDATGTDDPDPDFLDHYLAGYYDTGTLVLPEEPSDEDGRDSTDQGTTSTDTNSSNEEAASGNG